MNKHPKKLTLITEWSSKISTISSIEKPSPGLLKLKLAIFLLLLTVLVGTGARCLSDNTVDAWSAQQRVNTSYFAKLSQCEQTTPYFFILVPFDVYESDLLACEADLLASACPLNFIPGNCILLAFKKASKDDLDK